MGKAVRVLLTVVVLLAVAVMIGLNETLLNLTFRGLRFVVQALAAGVATVAGCVLGVYLLKRPIAFLTLYILRRPIANFMAQLEPSSRADGDRLQADEEATDTGR